MLTLAADFFLIDDYYSVKAAILVKIKTKQRSRPWEGETRLSHPSRRRRRFIQSKKRTNPHHSWRRITKASVIISPIFASRRFFTVGITCQKTTAGAASGGRQDRWGNMRQVRPDLRILRRRPRHGVQSGSNIAPLRVTTNNSNSIRKRVRVVAVAAVTEQPQGDQRRP